MKRRLFKLALFIFLGAIVNVAVAWGCALWITLDPVEDTTTWGIDFSDGNDWLLAKTQSNGAMLIYSHWDNLELYRTGSSHTFDTATSQINMHFTFIHLPYDKLLKLSYLERILTAYGWPRLAIWSGYELQNPISRTPSFTIKTGFRISGEQFAPYRHLKIPRTLPYRPIWSGFAFNTIFYSTILWLLTLDPFTARRMLRIKHGLCIKCGYDLRGAEHNACPECGVELYARAKAPS